MTRIPQKMLSKAVKDELFSCRGEEQVQSDIEKQSS
jgi:hypothetical protein